MGDPCPSQKKSTQGIKAPKPEIDLIRERLKRLRRCCHGRRVELVRGGDNPFDDVGLPDTDTKLIKADLAASKLSVVFFSSCGERRLTGAAAAKLVGIQTADMSRIRPNADVSRFTY